jgi:hypothetical protein
VGEFVMGCVRGQCETDDLPGVVDEGDSVVLEGVFPHEGGKASAQELSGSEVFSVK